MRRTTPALAVLFLVAAAAGARGEERTVVLKNGARLTGEIENEAGPVMIVHTKNGDAVRVPLNMVQQITKAKKDAPKPKDPVRPDDKSPDGGKAASESAKTPDGAKPDAVAAVASRTPPPPSLVEKRCDEIAALGADDRARAVLALGAEVSLEALASLLADAPPGPPAPRVAVALDALCERGGPARSVALARLVAQNDCSPPLFKALERLWDAQGAVEEALSVRLRQEVKDKPAILATLAARGSRKAVPVLVETLFFSPEKDGLTFGAQVALREIAKRDENPDECLEPLVKHVAPGWPGPKELVRRRDVILAMGASSGAALDWFAGTLDRLATNDVEPRGDCWLSLARMGSKESLALLARTFRETKVTGITLEARRAELLVRAIAETNPQAAARPDFLLSAAALADNLERDEYRSRLLAAVEKVAARPFKDWEAVRRVASDMLQKELNEPETPR